MKRQCCHEPTAVDPHVARDEHVVLVFDQLRETHCRSRCDVALFARDAKAAIVERHVEHFHTRKLLALRLVLFCAKCEHVPTAPIDVVALGRLRALRKKRNDLRVVHNATLAERFIANNHDMSIDPRSTARRAAALIAFALDEAVTAHIFVVAVVLARLRGRVIGHEGLTRLVARV